MMTSKKLMRILNRLEGIEKKDWETLKKLVDEAFEKSISTIEFTDAHIDSIHVRLYKEGEITLPPE